MQENVNVFFREEQEEMSKYVFNKALPAEFEKNACIMGKFIVELCKFLIREDFLTVKMVSSGKRRGIADKCRKCPYYEVF